MKTAQYITMGKTMSEILQEQIDDIEQQKTETEFPDTVPDYIPIHCDVAKLIVLLLKNKP